MKDKLNAMIKMAFEAPPPDRREVFLGKISYSPERESAWYDMIPAQLSYIHKSAWVCAALVFVGTLYFLSGQNENTVFMVAALTPFLALSVLIESNRSRRYNMSELEAATRYSLRSAVFCKMLILGIFDLVFLLLVIIITGIRSGNGMLLTGTYILLPYLLTMWMGLMTERTQIGRRTPYAGVGVSIVFPLILLIMINSNHQWLHPDYGSWWEILVIFSVAGIIAQIKNKAKCPEDAVWN